MNTLRAAKTIPPESRRAVRIEGPVDDPLSALIARLMDTTFIIPGTGIRFGFDALIGLVPGVGDSAGALVSSILIAQSARLGVPRIILARMAGNVLLNTLVGAVPIFGDVFSVFYRSNVRNYALLQRHAGHRRKVSARDWIFVAGILLLMLAIVGAIVGGAIFLVARLRAH